MKVNSKNNIEIRFI